MKITGLEAYADHETVKFKDVGWGCCFFVPDDPPGVCVKGPPGSVDGFLNITEGNYFTIHNQDSPVIRIPYAQIEIVITPPKVKNALVWSHYGNHGGKALQANALSALRSSYRWKLNWERDGKYRPDASSPELHQYLETVVWNTLDAAKAEVQAAENRAIAAQEKPIPDMPDTDGYELVV